MGRTVRRGGRGGWRSGFGGWRRGWFGEGVWVEGAERGA